MSPEPRQRSIAPFGARTPLLVPSFSSRGAPDVGRVLEAIRGDLDGTCLVSAYDVRHGLVPQDLGNLADVLFVDSGGYEVEQGLVEADRHYELPAREPWTRAEYRAWLPTFRPPTNVVAVNLDTRAPVPEQLDLAAGDFALAPEAAQDVLIKPATTDARVVEVAGLLGHADRLRDFSILGLTDVELGRSLLDRCRNVVALRSGLSGAGVEIPIHVFGCITPAATLAYFLCGADVFDGLNWLRYAFGDDRPTNHHEASIRAGTWERADGDLFVGHWRRNLRALARAQAAHRRYAEGGPVADLLALTPDAPRAIELARAAGATVRE